MTLHRNQFIFGPRPLLAGRDWVARQIGGSFLSHSKSLQVAGEGARLVLGVAVETDERLPPPAEAIVASAEPEVTIRSWAGRFAVLCDGLMRGDAAGTLGIYWRQLDGGATWISSSAALLAELGDPPRRVGGELGHGVGMDWYPLPGSGFEGVRRLLPSQMLALDGSTIPRPALPPISSSRPYKETLDAMSGRLRAALAATGSLGRPVWVALSGGRDSRLILAAAHAAGVAVHTYTFDYPGISRGDRELPPRLAESIGAPHVFVRAGRELEERLHEIDRHTAGQSAEIDRQFYARGQWDAVPDNVIDLGGGVFEVGRCYYHHYLPEQMPSSAEAYADAVAAKLPTGRPDALTEFAAHVIATHIDGLDWRDRLYLEQRSAGWLSAVGQAIDCAGPGRVHLASCGALIADLLSVPSAIRRTGSHQDHLVKRLSAPLARLPVNPADSVRAQVQGRLIGETRLLRAEGGLARYARQRASRLFERIEARRADSRPPS